MVMAWHGGKATGILGEYESEMKLLREAIREEAPRIRAAQEAWNRCRKANTFEACE